MSEEFLNKKIGTKETESLKPAKVVVQGVRLVEKKKEEVLVGKLLTLICKHPDKEETIDISTAKVIVNENIKMTALWYNLDEDENLKKGSTAALLLNHYGANCFGDLEGKELETTVQSEKNPYLCIKAY